MTGRENSESPRAEVWEGLDRQFRAPLIAYFKRRIADQADAEDLAQQVFLRLMRRPDQHNGVTLSAYVFKIAASVLKDWGRRRASHRASDHRAIFELSENVSLPHVLVEDRTPERVWVSKVALRDIETALGELSPRAREIFLLSRMENVNHREIATLYGISVSAVEKHVQRVVAHLSAKALEP